MSAPPSRNFRIFVAWPHEIQCVDAPPGVEEAYDIMVADRVPAETAAEMAVAASRNGKDPVEFARHFVRMRKVYREVKHEQAG